MLDTHKTMSGVSVTKGWAKIKDDLTKTKLGVTLTQRETVAWLQGKRQRMWALALFLSLLSHTLAYKLEALSFDWRYSLFLCDSFIFSSFCTHTLFLKQLSMLPQHTHSQTRSSAQCLGNTRRATLDRIDTQKEDGLAKLHGIPLKRASGVDVNGIAWSSWRCRRRAFWCGSL